MTDTCEFSPEPKFPAAKQPCIECPFRKSNADIEAKAGWYSQDNFERIWRQITRGGFFGCHMFDSPQETWLDADMHAAGYRKPANLGGRKSCAGIDGMIFREIQIAETYPSYEAYLQARPVGLREEAWNVVKARLAGEIIPLTVPAHHAHPDLADPEDRVRLNSTSWLVSEDEILKLARIVRELQPGQKEDEGCDCPVCVRHTEAHAPAVLTTATGEEVQVDATLHPLLTALASCGVRTVASCENLNDAMTKLWPEQIPFILQPTRGLVSYAEPVATGKAVIRYLHSSPVESQLTGALRTAKWASLQSGAEVTQVSFDLRHLGDFGEITESLSRH